MSDTDFPINAHVYAIDEVRLGEFGGSASTYDDSLAAPDPIRRETFVRTPKPSLSWLGEVARRGGLIDAAA